MRILIGPSFKDSKDRFSTVTLKALIKHELDINVFFNKLFIFIWAFSAKVTCIFLTQGTVVNQAMPSLHGASLEITLTVPLNVNII